MNASFIQLRHESHCFFFYARLARPGATVREPIRRFDKTEFTVWKLGAARLLLPSYVGASMADSSAEYVRPEGVDYPVARARTSPVNWRCAGSSSRSVLNELRRPPWPPALSSTKETSVRDFPREKAVSIRRRLSWMDNTDLKLTLNPLPDAAKPLSTTVIRLELLHSRYELSYEKIWLN